MPREILTSQTLKYSPKIVIQQKYIFLKILGIKDDVGSPNIDSYLISKVHFIVFDL